MKHSNYKFLALALFLASQAVHSESSFFVYGVRNDFALSDQEQTFKDYYVNMGSKQGVKEGTLLDVYRTISTADELNKRMAKNISFRVAKLRIIHAENEVSVARLQETAPPQDTPVSGFGTVVVGDAVEVGHK